MSKAVIVLCVVLYHAWYTAASTENVHTMSWVSATDRYSSYSRSDEHAEPAHILRRNGRQGNVNTTNTTVWNCSLLYDKLYGYDGSSCSFIQENCQSKSRLMNYLAFMKCDLPDNAQVRHGDKSLV